jgi:hypothetical protein
MIPIANQKPIRLLRLFCILAGILFSANGIWEVL